MASTSTKDSVLVMDGSADKCPFDKLRYTMRAMYYEIAKEGHPPDAIAASADALIAYEERCEQNDPPLTTFKGLPMRLSTTLLREMAFYRRGEQVGLIRNIY